MKTKECLICGMVCEKQDFGIGWMLNCKNCGLHFSSAFGIVDVDFDGQHFDNAYQGPRDLLHDDLKLKGLDEAIMAYRFKLDKENRLITRMSDKDWVKQHFKPGRVRCCTVWFSWFQIKVPGFIWWRAISSVCPTEDEAWHDAAVRLGRKN